MMELVDITDLKSVGSDCRAGSSPAASTILIKEERMGWIDVNERLPKKEEPCWYFFDIVGTHRGFYGGLYEDEDGNEWGGMSIFYNETGWLTGDVTHWHPDQEERPLDPFVVIKD